MNKSFLESMVAWSLSNKFFVFLLTFLFIIITFFQLPRLGVDAVPDITNTQVVINTKTQGLDPKMVELSVTRLIELEMMGLERLNDMRSISKYGLSQVTLIFEDDVDLYWARQRVSEKLQSVSKDLPPGISPELGPISTGLGEVFMYALVLKPGHEDNQSSVKEQLLFLRDVQDFVIRPHLRKIQGVADVDSNGGLSKEVHINLVPQKLTSFGLGLDDVVNALSGFGEGVDAGVIEVNKKTLIVSSTHKLTRIKELEDISLKQDFSGKMIRLKDVASVSYDGTPRIGAATYNGKETVLGTVLMQTGGNGRQVSHDVNEALSQITLPANVELKILYSRSYLVNETLKTVIKNLSEGAILVILVLLLLLGHFKAASIVSLIIPLSMLGTTLGMSFLGISGNLMSLGAIDFGLVVDGAVVLVESVVGALLALPPEERKTANKDEIIRNKTFEIIRPVFFGILMIMMVYLPLLYLEGVEGKMFRPMAYTVVMTLGWSMFFTIFLVPVLVSVFVKIPKGEITSHETLLFKKVQKIYLPILNKVIHFPKTLGISLLVFGILGLVAFVQLGTDFVPELDEGDLVVNITRNSSISLSESIREQTLVEKRINDIPEVELVFSRLGTPESATDPMGVHLADTFVMLKKDRSLWTVKSKEEVFQKVKDAIHSVNSLQDVSSTQPIEMRFNEMLEGSRADVSLRVVGEDLTFLIETLEKYAQKVQGISGLESAEMDPLTALRKGPVLEILPRFDELSRQGVSLHDFNQTISAFMHGIVVGQWVEGARNLPLMLHLSEARRNNLDEIKNLPLSLSGEGVLPLSHFAHISEKSEVTTIARKWGERYAALSLNVAGRDILGFVEDVKSKIKDLPLKDGHKLILGGQFNNLESAKKRLLVIIPLALIFIFLILWKEFSSLRDALLIFLCVPFATIGGVFALYLREIHLSLSAAVGFMALVGIALLNGIVLITIFNQLKKRSQSRDLEEIIIEGTMSRLRPVLMTALVAAIGFVPMAFNTGPGAEVQRPLATVVIGGIMFSTLLTLVLVPTFYLWVNKNKWR